MEIEFKFNVNDRVTLLGESYPTHVVIERCYIESSDVKMKKYKLFSSHRDVFGVGEADMELATK